MRKEHQKRGCRERSGEESYQGRDTNFAVTWREHMSIAKQLRTSRSVLLILWPLLFFAVAFYGQRSKVMGEIQFTAATQVEKHCGIWVDGQYVGYLDELKGDRKVMLLPGEHEIGARQSGYKDFT